MAEVLDAKDAEQSSRPEADDVKLEEEDLIKCVGEIEVDVEAPAIPALGSASGSESAAPSISSPSTSLSTSPSGSASASSSASISTSNQPNTAQGQDQAQAHEGDDNSSDDDDDDYGPLGPEYLFDYEKTPRQPDSPTTVPITVYPPVSPPPRIPSPPRTSDFQPIPVNSTTLGRPYTAPSLSTREPEYTPVAFSPTGFPTHYRPNPPSSPIPELLGPAGPTHELVILKRPDTGEASLDPATRGSLFKARPISANDSARILRNLPALPPPAAAAPKEPESDTEAPKSLTSNTTVTAPESDTRTPETLTSNTTVTDTVPISGPSNAPIPPGPPQQPNPPNSAPASLPSQMAPRVPKPGPARLGPRAGLDEWLEQAKLCRYLPESAMKQLCEMVKECLMEESNIQPVRTPVTICGDIHGQFFDILELFRVSGGMPGETNVQAPTTMISSGDVPTTTTDPSGGDSGLGSSVSSGTEDDGEESRGRPRTAGSGSSGASSINANLNTGSGKQNFIFLGDFVDRGYFSLETLTLLMCLKAKYPDRITLVRGNHESRQITQVYGFYEECQQKYGNASVWKACCQVFDFLILAAIVDGAVLCVHGGLSPEIRTLDQIRVVARAQEIPHEGAFCDLVWSDPEDVETWAVSPRGAGWLFGDKVASEFNQVNGLKLIARAHQLVNEGYKYHFQQKSVVTVWSAPNYCYRCGNVASIMNVGEDLEPKFSIFSAVPEDQRAVPASRRGAGEYFL